MILYSLPSSYAIHQLMQQKAKRPTEVATEVEQAKGVKFESVLVYKIPVYKRKKWN